MNSTTPVNPTSHVDEVTGLLYIEGQLEPAAAREVVAHLERCSPCRKLLDTLKRESLLLRAALTEQDEPVPARLLAPPVSEGRSWWWLGVSSFAAAGLYMLWTFYLEPWMSSVEQSGFGGQFFFTWLLLNGASWKGWNDMLQWMIVGSVAVLASVLLFLLRRNLRRLTSLSIFLGAVTLAGLAHPPASHAAEFVKQNGSYDVPEGRTVKNDLFVMAASVRMAGTIEGDLFCFCSSLTVEGHVTGDVFAFSHALRITGKVDGNVRAFTSTLTIDGDVQRNVLSFVGDFHNTPRSHVEGSAALFVAHLELDGPLGRDLAATVGGGSIDAPIGGNVRIRQHLNSNQDHYGFAREDTLVRVDSRADIKGSFLYKGPWKPEISPQAHLASAPEIQITVEPPWYRRPGNYWYNAMIWGTGLLVGLVFIAIAPGLAQDLSREAGRIGAPLGFGIVAFIIVPIIAVIACATVVGLGLGIPLFLIWVFLIFFGQVIPAMWIGEQILGRGLGTWPMAGRLAVGLFLIRLGALLPVVGFWVRFLAGVLGIGAVALLLFRRYQPLAAPPRTTPAPAAPSAA